MERGSGLPKFCNLNKPPPKKTKQMSSVWLIRLTNTVSTLGTYNTNAFNDSSAIHTPTVNTLDTYKTNYLSAIHTPTINKLDTYKTNAFCMSHQVQRQGLTTYLVLIKQMPSVWLNRDRHLMLTSLVLTKQWPYVWLIRLTNTVTILGTCNTNAFWMTHQPYTHQLSTHLILTKQMLSVWLIRCRDRDW